MIYDHLTLIYVYIHILPCDFVNLCPSMFLLHHLKNLKTKLAPQLPPARGSQEAPAPLQRLAVELFGLGPLALTEAGGTEVWVRLI